MIQIPTTGLGKDKFSVKVASGVVTKVQLWYVTKALPSGDKGYVSLHGEWKRPIEAWRKNPG